MRSACLALLTAALLLTGLPGRLLAAEPDELAEDELLLREAKIPTEGPALLDFFRKRTLNEATEKRVGELVRLLGNDDFATRAKATDDLKELGPAILPLLRRALGNVTDPEAKSRLRDCIDIAEATPNAERATAAIHLVRARKPDGCVGVLLAYLPFADDEYVENEVLTTLAVVGVRDGKVDDALAAALKDKEPLRRGAAALVLGCYGTKDQQRQVRLLLTDPDARIRLRAAQGLLAAHDSIAVPALLALLADDRLETARQAEDLLGRLAGEGAPSITLGEEAKTRAKCQEAWQTWWKTNESKLDLAHADVALTTANADTLSKTVCRQLFQGIVKGDKALVLKSIDVPFDLMGIQSINTKEEFTKMLLEGRPPQEEKAKLLAVRTITVDEYAKKAGPEAQEFLKHIKQARGRLVYMQIETNNRKEGAVFLVRVNGGKARVVGLGSADHGEP